MQNHFIDIVFDGPPGPVAGRFVEVENAEGKSINAGEWIDRGNGLWSLRIGVAGNPKLIAVAPELLDVLNDIVRSEWTTVSLLAMTTQHRARLERARSIIAKATE